MTPYSYSDIVLIMELKEILRELNKTMRQEDIAAAIGSSQPTIQRLIDPKSKAQPRYETGKAIERLALMRGIFVVKNSGDNAQ